MELYLIRHAQSVNNALPVGQRVHDPSLTDKGFQQAKLLGEFIPQLNLTGIVVSPFLRTLQTAHQIHRATQLTPFVRSELHELGGCVAGTHASNMVGQPGLGRAEIAEQFPGFEVCASITDSGWWNSQPYEKLDDATERAGRLLDETQQNLGDSEERVAYVMHGDFKVLFLRHVESQPYQTAWNGSVTKIRISRNDAEIEFYNKVEHLSDDLLTN